MSTLLRETAYDYRKPLPADDSSAGVSPARPLPRLAIVVPCFNEEEALPQTAERLTALLERLRKAGRIAAESRIMFVDDGSRDRTWQLIEALRRAQALAQSRASERAAGGALHGRRRCAGERRCGPAG
jgi:cellulose synthase/poly-beta-1,6-N-acetylglucosamine synthase-like glycosyltransferase